MPFSIIVSSLSILISCSKKLSFSPIRNLNPYDNLPDFSLNFNLNFSLKSNGDDFELDFGFDFKIGKVDKQLFDKTDDLDFIARNEIQIVDNVNEYKFSEEVNDLYLDSTDYKKHKISIPRVPMTNQY